MTPSQSGSSPSGGEGGGEEAGGAAGEAGQGPVVVSVSRFDTVTFDQTSPFEEPANILVEAAGGETLQASWPGAGTVELEGVARLGFLLVSPADTTMDAVPTLLQLPPDAGSSLLALPLVRASLVQGIISVSQLPLEVIPGRGQLVVRVVDAEFHSPVAGVQITEPSAEVVLYSANGVYTNSVSETDSSGLAALINVGADAWPGRLSSVTLSGTVLGSAPVRTVSDGVAVIEARIAP